MWCAGLKPAWDSFTSLLSSLITGTASHISTTSGAADDIIVSVGSTAHTNSHSRSLAQSHSDDSAQMTNQQRRRSSDESTPQNLELSNCPLLNISVCAASVELSQQGKGVIVPVYNPLGWERRELVRVPISLAASKDWAVKGGAPLCCC